MQSWQSFQSAAQSFLSIKRTAVEEGSGFFVEHWFQKAGFFGFNPHGKAILQLAEKILGISHMDVSFVEFVAVRIRVQS